jgi:hypothetical protein
LYTNNVRPWDDDNIILKPGSHSLIFRRGQEWVTPTGYKFAFQHDGNLVLYTPDGKAIWATGTHGTGADSFAVQADGNVVLYDHGKAVWATDTAGNPGAYFAIQGDGNLIVYSQDSKPLFNTGTNGGQVRQLNTASRDWLNKYQSSTKPGYVNGNVGSGSLNFRSSPSLGASVIGKLYQGNSLTILEKVTGGTYSGRNDWYKVKVGDQIGYVAAYYISEGSNNNSGGKITTYAQYLQRLYGGSPGKITQTPSSSHMAIDSVHQGASPYKVYSLTDGVVRSIRTDQYGGKYVTVWNSKLQRTFLYLHFNSYNPNLRVGQTVKAGDYLGNEGWSGYTRPSGPGGRHTHVHVLRSNGTKENPFTSLSKL